jgi:hypothetical protein
MGKSALRSFRPALRRGDIRSILNDESINEQLMKSARRA